MRSRRHGANDRPGNDTRRATSRRVVARFEQDIALLRSLQGNEAAARLKERLLPATLENELVMKGGYCALAAHLKAKKLAN